MKYIQNIKPEHLEELRNLIPENPEIINILEWARKVSIPGESDSIIYEDSLLRMDLQSEVFENKSPLRVIFHNREEVKNPRNYPIYKPVIRDYEPDIVLFSLRFNELKELNEEIKLKVIFTYIMVILLSDCTGCCNALSFINLSSDGIIAYGVVSSTYHS